MKVENPFKGIYKGKVDVILYAHDLIGAVRGKSANGLMIHEKLFNIVAIVDKNAAGKDTSEICHGVQKKVPIYSSMNSALVNHKAKALIFLISPDKKWYNDIEICIQSGLDLINTTFDFIKDDQYILNLIKHSDVKYFDLRDKAYLKAYPNVEILNRDSRIVFVTGTDCSSGKRISCLELTQCAKRRGINATMYASGQTSLMLGESGITIDSLTMEYANGVISQQINHLCTKGYEIIFVEGQADIFHPAYSVGTLSLLHGSNPDCIVLAHDDKRKTHVGFDEKSDLYTIHPVQRYIKAFEILSLPCGPIYKTVAIATIGMENLMRLKSKVSLPVADVRKPGGCDIILNVILEYFNKNYNWQPSIRKIKL